MVFTKIRFNFCNCHYKTVTELLFPMQRNPIAVKITKAHGACSLLIISLQILKLPLFFLYESTLHLTQLVNTAERALLNGRLRNNFSGIANFRFV